MCIRDRCGPGRCSVDCGWCREQTSSQQPAARLARFSVRASVARSRDLLPSSAIVCVCVCLYFGRSLGRPPTVPGQLLMPPPKKRARIRDFRFEQSNFFPKMGCFSLFFSPTLESPTSVVDRSGALIALRVGMATSCLLYTSPSPRDATLSRMPSSA